MEKIIQYFDQPCKVACDEKCEKAWGINNRPRVQLSDDPDDYAFLSDDELAKCRLILAHMRVDMGNLYLRRAYQTNGVCASSNAALNRVRVNTKSSLFCRIFLNVGIIFNNEQNNPHPRRHNNPGRKQGHLPALPNAHRL